MATVSCSSLLSSCTTVSHRSTTKQHRIQCSLFVMIWRYIILFRHQILSVRKPSIKESLVFSRWLIARVTLSLIHVLLLLSLFSYIRDTLLFDENNTAFQPMVYVSQSRHANCLQLASVRACRLAYMRLLRPRHFIPVQCTDDYTSR